MKKLLIIFLLFFSFNCFSQEKWLIYIEEYKILNEKDRKSLVFYFTQDSAVTYIPYYGYFKWKIDKNNLSKQNNNNLIIKGNIELSYKKHKSELFVTNSEVIQLIYLHGNPPIVLLIEFKRRHPKS